MTTSSWGSGAAAKAYRAAQRDLIKKGKFKDAFDMDVRDIRKQFGSKYDEAIAQARAYMKTLPTSELKPGGRVGGKVGKAGAASIVFLLLMAGSAAEAGEGGDPCLEPQVPIAPPVAPPGDEEGGWAEVFAPTAMSESEREGASIGDVVKAGAWDVAKAIDPVFLTDALEWGFGVGEFAPE
jgi:hypothetical protein